MAFTELFTESITMYYRTGDTYADGEYVEGSETSVAIVASVQRLNMRERQLLQEGYRARDTIKIFIADVATIQLIENNLTLPKDAAEFLFKGKRYDMIASESWDYLIPHWKITAVAE
jgi:hypothetical protein